jgi:outer membrane protein OmpA-like peptidoglycan-associated protein
MRLSRERATAVAQYMIANLGMSIARVRSVGYGKNRPIANNDTSEGRAKNRRIDVVIKSARSATN